MRKVIQLIESPLKAKKWRVVFEDGTKVDFGAKGYSDYTLHKDVKRKKSYEARHKPGENWGITGIKTAGFWSKWLLWNKPGLRESIKDMEQRFRLKIVRKRLS